MLASKIVCCTGTADARQQTHSLRQQRLIVRENGPIHYYCPHMNPRTLAISGPLEGTEFLIGEADLKIGRGARNNVSLNDPLVSPKHCCLSFEYDRCLLWDCGSEHGTFVNEFSFPAKIVVHGDHIRVGRTVFLFLLQHDVDEGLLMLTDTERNWCYNDRPSLGSAATAFRLLHTRRTVYWTSHC